MATFEQFASDMRRTASTVRDEASKLQRRVAVAVDQAVVVGTPVDTGRARSNWLAGIGGPRTDTRETLGASAAGDAVAEATRIIESAPPGQDIHISNNLPYIQRLNEGHSAQAPAGFVESAIVAAAREIVEVKLIP